MVSLKYHCMTGDSLNYGDGYLPFEDQLMFKTKCVNGVKFCKTKGTNTSEQYKRLMGTIPTLYYFDAFCYFMLSY